MKWPKIALFVLCSTILAGIGMADTSTTRIGLTKPTPGSAGWAPKLNTNFDIVDASAALLGADNTFTAKNTFSSMTVSGSTLGVNGLGYQWPASAGAATFLKNDGSNNLSWGTPTGAGTVNSGSLNQLAYYASPGTAVSGWTAMTANRAVITDTNGLPISTGTTNTQINGLANLFKYKRPNMIWVSSGTVTVETGTVTGVAGDVSILYPDGSLFTTNNTTYTVFDIGRTAVLTGTKKSGLYSGSASSNTIYSLYSCQATDSNDNIFVGTTTYPTYVNFAALNTMCSANKWVYLGPIRYGDGNGNPMQIPAFVQNGNHIRYINNETGGFGFLISSGASVGSVSWTYAAGSNNQQMPPNIVMLDWLSRIPNVNSSSQPTITDATNTRSYYVALPASAGNTTNIMTTMPTSEGIESQTNTGNGACKIWTVGLWDNALGIGSNPFF